MRSSDAFLRELDMVAVLDGQIVGSIVYTRSVIRGEDGTDHPVITFGPISVLPALQGKGIGRMLIKHTVLRARELGHLAILIYGDPKYYERFGFVPAERYGIGTPDGMYAVPLQALELQPGALSGAGGRFFEDPVFDVDDALAEAFDRQFPQLELRGDLPTQDRFRELVNLRVPMASRRQIPAQTTS
jgi:predicted N-acetyltransferase YhbS